MPTYYVGAGGNDAWNGLTWATRKLTLNGAEDVPVVAGDVVYVAPGVYREMLTCDVSGAAGSPVVYIGDRSGENTDGVGGVVRVTGSDNDQTQVRASCIICVAQRNYRTFRGFTFDTCSGYLVTGGVAVTGTNWIIEDCILLPGAGAARYGIVCGGANQAAWIIRRCNFIGNTSGLCIWFYHTADVSNSGHIVENCIIIGSGVQAQVGIGTSNVGGITIRNCTLHGHGQGISIIATLAGGQTLTVNNCIVEACYIGLYAIAADGTFVENYNNVYDCSGALRTNVAVGANSVSYPSLFDLGILHSGASQVSGFRFPPPLFGALSQWSQVRAIADTGAATEDILGLTRPVTAGKRSWGAVQYVDMARDTATVHAGTASKKLADAGRDQIYVPTTAVSTVFSVYVYRDANYAGVNPQMIIKQPGQADTVVTDAGVAGAWNQLTATLTPAALPGYVVIELVSNNTAAAGNYGVYFDDLTVT